MSIVNFYSCKWYLSFWNYFSGENFSSIKLYINLLVIILLVHCAISWHEVSAEKRKLCQGNMDKCMFKGKKNPNGNWILAPTHNGIIFFSEAISMSQCLDREIGRASFFFLSMCMYDGIQALKICLALCSAACTKSRIQ